MPGNARQTTGRPSKKPVFFEDPDRPGKSRHARCFRKAGIDAKRLRYPTTAGPCWVCEAIKGRTAVYQGCLAALEEDRELATLLDAASEAAFALAKEACSVWGLRIIQRTELEREHARTLAAFRRAWSRARAAALLPTESGQAGGESEPRWRRVPIPDPPLGADPKESWFFNVGPTLASDPTLAELVRIDDLHASAGSVAAAARLFREDAERGIEQLRATKGKDRFDLALRLANGKVSPEWLAKAMHGVEHPFDKQARKPTDTDEQWAEAERAWNRSVIAAEADADTLRQRMSRTRKTARSKSRARRKNTVE